MEKERSFKVISVIALIIGVIGLTLGFAAFTSTLTIRSSVEVKPAGNTFNVNFSSTSGLVETNDIEPSVSSPNVVATNATIDNTGNPTISGLNVTFTEPGQSATYEFHSYNGGEYSAYLNSIVYENIANGTSPKVCTPKPGTTESLVASVCSDIVVSVKVGNEPVTTGSVSKIANHSLKKGNSEDIVITISYVKKDEQTLVDGDFTVSFGNIVLDYSSVD